MGEGVVRMNWVNNNSAPQGIRVELDFLLYYNNLIGE